MAFTKVHSGHVVGIRGEIIDVEIDITRGLYAFSIVGLADRITEQARDRVASAIKNSGLISPKKKSEKVVVSLAPANIRKEGSGFDLAIAIGYLLASDDVYFNPKNTLFFGELSLDGHIRPAQGILPVVIAAQERGITRIFTSKEDAPLIADLVDNITVYGINTLQDLVLFMKGQKKIRPNTRTTREDIFNTKNAPIVQNEDQLARQNTITAIDPFSRIEGEILAKQALVVAIAGGHHIALIGTPGSGKTSLAEASALLIPRLTRAKQIEVAAIYSAYQKTVMSSATVSTKAPYRTPHHTTKISGIIGSIHGGPGEITLAHNGVLHLDELSLMDKQVLDALRTPLEATSIHLSAGNRHETMPCDFTLIATMNPCACGYFGSKIKRCICSARTLSHYHEKINSPLMDRIPLCITMDGHLTTHPDTATTHNGKCNEQKPLHTKKKDETRLPFDPYQAVENARSMQRFQKELNGKMPIEELLKRKTFDQEAKIELLTVTQKAKLSSRVVTNIIRIAATLTDMSLKNSINTETINLAILLSGRVRTEKY